LSAITQNLDEPHDLGFLQYGGDLTGGPDPAAVLADSPSFLTTSSSKADGVSEFMLQLIGTWRKNAIQRLPHHFGFAPTQQSSRSNTPAGNTTLPIEADDGCIYRAIDDLAPLRCCDVSSLGLLFILHSAFELMLSAAMAGAVGLFET
jgi:hypothetical protein